MNMDAMYTIILRNSAMNISQCQVRIVNATINSSVMTSDVYDIATMCKNSPSNNIRAPYIIMPP